MNTDAKYYNAFNLTGEIGPVRFKKLSAYFGLLKNAWSADKTELLKSGIEESIADKIVKARTKISPDSEWEKLTKESISVITLKDDLYPKLLREIYSPPAILYVRGKLRDNMDFPIAIVGSRKVSTYGEQVTKDISGALAKAGATVISGMAYGIDIIAHEAAIASGGKTIAVLASGLDWTNLSSKRRIAERIIQNGAVISEYPIGIPSYKGHFPIRNRIISGLSLGVVVVEAAKKSGTLITARLALEQNREVFAVPGSIYWPNSQGTNDLIKSGAKTVASYEDILEDLHLTKIENYTNNRRIVPKSPEEETISLILNREPLHIDAVAQKTKMDVSKIASILMLMEMKGMVKNLGGGNYAVMK